MHDHLARSPSHPSSSLGPLSHTHTHNEQKPDEIVASMHYKRKAFTCCVACVARNATITSARWRQRSALLRMRESRRLARDTTEELLHMLEDDPTRLRKVRRSSRYAHRMATAADAAAVRGQPVSVLRKDHPFACATSVLGGMGMGGGGWSCALQ